MKEFNFKDYELPAQIREHKDVSYTITVIGGPKELAAWKESQAALRASREASKREAFAVKKILLSHIIDGLATASPEALKTPETLSRLQWDLGAPRPTPVQPSNIEMTSVESGLPTPTWYNKIGASFKRVITKRVITG
jgi:hypothetical protein